MRIPCPSSLQRILDISTAWGELLTRSTFPDESDLERVQDSSKSCDCSLVHFAVVAWSGGFGKVKTLVTQGAREFNVVVPQASIQSLFFSSSVHVTNTRHSSVVLGVYSHGDADVPGRLAPRLEQPPPPPPCILNRIAWLDSPGTREVSIGSGVLSCFWCELITIGLVVMPCASLPVGIMHWPA
jgi:hypothetical protein